MKNEVERLRDQMVRSLEADAWHGPVVSEILSGMTARTARERPIPAAHTAWEILLHMTSTCELVLSRLEGEARVLSPEEDWPSPPDEGGDEEWGEAVARFKKAMSQVLGKIPTIPESRLDQPIVPGFSSIYVTLHGLVQHNLYHAGQIAILRKASAH